MVIIMKYSCDISNLQKKLINCQCGELELKPADKDMVFVKLLKHIVTLLISKTKYKTMNNNCDVNENGKKKKERKKENQKVITCL